MNGGSSGFAVLDLEIRVQGVRVKEKGSILDIQGFGVQ